MTTSEIKTLLIHALNLCCDGGCSPFTEEKEKELKEFIHNAIDIEKPCNWLKNNFYHEETMVDCIAYKHEDYDVYKMVEDFRKAMEE